MANKSFGQLTKSFEYRQLRMQGMRYLPVEWMLMNFKPNTEDTNYIGWTIPKKIGNAVVRNRMKRWLRSFFLFA